MLEGRHLEIRVTDVREAKNADVEEFARELLVLVDCSGEHQEKANTELVHTMIIVTNLLASSDAFRLVEMSTNCYIQFTLAQISTN